MVVRVVVRLELGGAMRMIMRLQHVVGVIVLVTLFACGMTVAVAVLMSVRMDVRVRMLMIVNRFAVAMLMSVCVGMPMLVLMPVFVLMPVLVTSTHESVFLACLTFARSRSPILARFDRPAPFEGTRVASRLQPSPRNLPAARLPKPSRWKRGEGLAAARLRRCQHPRAQRRRGGYCQSASCRFHFRGPGGAGLNSPLTKCGIGL